MVSTLLRHVHATLGSAGVDEIVRRSGVPYGADHLDDISHWIWYDEAVAVFHAAAEVTGDPSIGLRAGEQALRQHAGTPVATLLRQLGSPEAVLEQTSMVATKFTTVSEMRPTKVTPGHAVVMASAQPGITSHRVFCDFRAGLLSQITSLFGLPPARVTETRCRVDGHETCEYEVTWDADAAAGAGDPEQLITSLEGQLAAMARRLNSVYAAAKDLIAVDDVDVTLARITERAAIAVRAPKYLLAVRTDDGEVSFHHRGFADEDAQAAAHALLADEEPGADPTRLVAEVASMTRRYGRLMAASPAGAFFAHERELLEVYAGYAATALDTATALAESRREAARTRALLELSQAVATAGRSEDVAQQLVDAVPAVVDCDRVSAFLWRPEEGALFPGAVTGVWGDALERVRGLRIGLEDTEILGRLIASGDPTPLFFDQTTSDPWLGSIMREQKSLAILVAPIVAHDRFYGVLTASVVDRPERLQPTPDLRDRLAGVAAQAATAYDNARLIETMALQAATDNLTGLLGHRAFQEALGAAVGDCDGLFTLATIDIDDFKLVNDSHGHPVGDEALRRVAGALCTAVRDGDEVYRVGGEEFAVLMPGLAAADAVPVADRLRTAVAAVHFTTPLRISVGLASWPHDADGRDELLRRADEALYVAKRSGKDRTVAVAA